MRRRSRVFGLLVLVCAALAFGSLPARFPLPAAAAGRCSSQTTDEGYARVRDYDRHPAASTPQKLLARYSAIAEVLATMQEEREILDSICSGDSVRASLFAELAATVAWALALESDVAAKLNASCPAAAQALPSVMLADAWLDMANVINEGNDTVPSIFKDVIPKVQTRAAVVDLTLPVWADTSAYWRDGIREKAKALAATCPDAGADTDPIPALAGFCELFANDRPVASRAEYVTRPREWIASILAREPRFLSAAQIHQRLKRMGAQVSLSTVYRTLDHLRTKGDVTERAEADGESTYMLCGPAPHHHHAICRSCGRVEDVDCAATEKFAESLRALHGFQIDGHAMEFFGTCRDCK